MTNNLLIDPLMNHEQKHLDEDGKCYECGKDLQILSLAIVLIGNSSGANGKAYVNYCNNDQCHRYKILVK